MPTINEAFKTHGIRAEFEGMPAMVVPVTPELAETLDQEKVKKPAISGNMLLSWNNGDERKGLVINSLAANDINLLIKRQDGSDKKVNANSMTDAALRALRLRNAHREDVAQVEAANAKAQEEYQEAVDRGENPAEPEERKTEFTDASFKGIDGLATCLRSVMIGIKEDVLSDIKVKGKADSFLGEMRELTRDELTSSDKAKALEARRLKAEIAMLAPEHEKASATIMPAAYEGDGEAARDLMDAMPHDPEGLSAAQQSVMAQAGNIALVNRLFSVATTTPVMAVEKRALSHTGFATFAQNLAKYENKDASEMVLPRMAAVTGDAMEAYKWQGKIYTKDGADILLMRDEYAAFAYAWDTESRVGDINIEASVLTNLTQADVPTEEELEELKEIHEALKFDNGAEVNFDWDDEPEEEDVFEA